MAEVEVPPYFLCPISLEIMKDPVTITTGITYDRESIEKWIFQGKNNCCPVTKQTLNQDLEMTPNITLRRLIQAWCTLNASYGIERFPTPKPPASKTQILKIINKARNAPQKEVLKCVQSLRSIASQSETNKRCIESSGGVEFLVSMIKDFKENQDVKNYEEALCLLYNLKLSENGLRLLLGGNNEIVGSLIHVMQCGSYESRAYGVMLLKSMFEVADHTQMTSLKVDFFVELVQLLGDEVSNKASKAALKLLVDVCQWGRNKIKAVEAGLVSLLIDLILDCGNSLDGKRVCEMMFVLLDQLCKCAEGRAELLKHGAGLAMVSKKIFRVSNIVSEMAIKILYSIAKYSATNVVLQEMLNLGVVEKLCLVLQVDCGGRMKEKTREILKLHSRAWKNSPCIDMEVYPC